MCSLLLTAIIAAALGGAPAVSTPQATEGDPDQAPPGSPAEQSLWRRASDINDRVTTDRAAATRLQLRAKVAVDRLGAMAAAGALPAERAKALEREVVAVWTENVALLQRQWPVDPTRACRYDQLYYESAMRLPDGKRRAQQVAETRQALEQCLARAETALAKLAASRTELEHETAEVEQALARLVEPAAAPPSSPPASPGK